MVFIMLDVRPYCCQLTLSICCCQPSPCRHSSTLDSHYFIGFLTLCLSSWEPYILCGFSLFLQMDQTSTFLNLKCRKMPRIYMHIKFHSSVLMLKRGIKCQTGIERKRKKHQTGSLKRKPRLAQPSTEQRQCR